MMVQSRNENAARAGGVYRHAEWKKLNQKAEKNRRADKKRRRRRSKYVYRKFESISLHFFFSLLSCAARRLCLCNLIRVYFLLIELYSLFHPPRAAPTSHKKVFNFTCARRRSRCAPPLSRAGGAATAIAANARTRNVLRAPYLSEEEEGI